MNPGPFALLAQFAAESRAWTPNLEMPWFGWVAIVAILGGSLNGLFATVAKHRERMAMLQIGLHPDAPAPKADSTGKPFVRPDEL